MKTKKVIKLKPLEIATKYLHSHFGNRICLGLPVYEEKSKLHRIPLRSNYPFIIQDDEEDQMEIKVVPMERLGYIYVTEKNKIDLHMTSSRKEVIASVKNYLEIWTNSIENIVTGVTSRNLSNLEQFRQFIMPLQNILAYLQEMGSITESVWGSKGSAKRLKYLRYIRLLEDLDFLERKEGVWYSSNKLIQLRNGLESLEQLVKRVLAISIERRYATLIKVFNLRVFQRSIRLQNVVYLPEIQVERNIGRVPSTIRSTYHSRYNLRIPEFDLIAALGSLVGVGSVRRRKESKLYMGEEELLQKMLEKKSTIPKLETLHMGRAQGPTLVSVHNQRHDRPIINKLSY